VRDDHPTSQLDFDLLGRYLEGHATDAEREVVERWIASDERRREAFEELRWTWHIEGYARRPRFDARRAWAEMPMWVRAGLRSSGPVLRERVTNRWALRVAAAVVVAVGLGLWFTHRRTAPPPAPHDVAYTTQRGELRSFTLDDGTRVFLGAASRLIAPQKFGPERVVTLEGEGYFDVVHDPARPFRVRAPGMVVQDIGTSFSVRVFPGSEIREVAVRTGEVSVSPVGTRTARLTPGMLLRVANKQLILGRADTNSYFGWTGGRLVFRDQPLGEVIETLERWYKLTIVLDDSALASGRVTATFGPQSRSEIVRTLGGLVGARAVEQRGDTAYFRK
jgi:ferric-dicitrate binding protein FerR (iron transport regulator)